MSLGLGLGAPNVPVWGNHKNWMLSGAALGLDFAHQSYYGGAFSALVSHSRPSLATMYDANGKLTYCPNQLVIYNGATLGGSWSGDQGTLTNAIDDPFGGTDAMRLTSTATDYSGTYQNAPLPIPLGTEVMSAVWARGRPGNTATWQLYGADNLTGVTIGTTLEWELYWVKAKATDFGGSGRPVASIIYTSDASIHVGDSIDFYLPTVSCVTHETEPRLSDLVNTDNGAYFYGPRHTYAPVTRDPLGLLIEDTATNKIAWHIPNDTHWTGYTGTQPIVDNARLSPDGTMNCPFLPDGAGGGIAVGALADGTWTFSYHCAQHTLRRLPSIDLSATAGSVGFVMNPDTGQVWSYQNGSFTFLASHYEVLPDGFIRIGVTFSCTGVTDGVADIWISQVDPPGNTDPNPINSVPGDGSDGLYAWGAQIEPGSKMTSLVATYGATLSRAADLVSLTGAADTLLKGTNYSYVVEFGPCGKTDVGARIIGSGNDALDCYLNTPTTAHSYAGATFTPISDANYSSNRVAMSQSATSQAMAANGSAPNGAGATILNGTPDTVYLGSHQGTSLFANTTIKTLALYDITLNDAALQSKSVLGA